MRSRMLACTVVAMACAAPLALPLPAGAQTVRQLRDAARRAVVGETAAQVDRLLRNAIRCAIDDHRCVERARASGEEVIFVDERGEVITDPDGTPITDREAALAAAPRHAAPGEGAWANYDFVPGDEILFYEDFSHDEVGDFPRRMELVSGTWEVVEWNGSRFLRATSNGTLAIPLPSTLPDRFTLEYEVSLLHGNAYVRFTAAPAYHARLRTYAGSVATVEFGRVGLRSVGNMGPESLREFDRRLVTEGVAPIRIMADGDYLKMYLVENRVANAPNAVVPRTDRLYLAVGSASETHPVLIGPIRLATGGRDLYDRLAREGRVATQGILFATDSDRLRPESTPTLEEIGAMLSEHPDLRLSIEGHTDSDGDEAHNQDLSERRAASVSRFLVERYGVDPGRLETAGFGESRPAGDNMTPEGKQQNRRVELVRLP